MNSVLLGPSATSIRVMIASKVGVFLPLVIGFVVCNVVHTSSLKSFTEVVGFQSNRTWYLEVLFIYKNAIKVPFKSTILILSPSPGMFEFIFNSTHTDGLRRKMTAFRDICDPKNESKPIW